MKLAILALTIASASALIAPPGHGGFTNAFGQVWKQCGSRCTRTCAQPNPMCVRMCVAKYECPAAKPYWDAAAKTCLASAQCKLACPKGKFTYTSPRSKVSFCVGCPNGKYQYTSPNTGLKFCVKHSQTASQLINAHGVKTAKPTPAKLAKFDHIKNGKFVNGAKHGHQLIKNLHKKAKQVGGHAYSDLKNGKNSKFVQVKPMEKNGKAAKRTAAPTPSPTPKYVKKARYCRNGKGIVMMGFKGACAGKNYCRMCVCRFYKGGARLLQVGKNAKKQCGKPTVGSKTCKNVFCEYKKSLDVIQVYHKHLKVRGMQIATEGSKHHCAHNLFTNKCTCFCHGETNKLWHSYTNWYCATKNGKKSKNTHITYKKGSFPGHKVKCPKK
jgi:hypothetical protein